MDDKKGYEIFEGKTLSNLFEDIYNNSSTTRSRVDTLIEQLKKFVTNIDSAIVVVPLIKEYLDIKVKSDEHLVKLSDTIQRMLRNEKSSDEDGTLISEDEKRQILEKVPTYEEVRIKEQKRLSELGNQFDEIKTKLDVDVTVEKN